MKINVLANYYKDKNILRQKEIDKCFEYNLLNPSINFIIIESDNRLKFNDYFNKINKITSNEDINIICNSDIYFDNTIELCKQMQHNQSFALSRWDVQADNTVKLFDREDSQDTFIFKGPIKNIFGDFHLGYPGCDNRLCFEIEKAGYRVSNPSHDIKTYHLHLTNIRNYDRSPQFIVPPPYKTIKPSKLII